MQRAPPLYISREARTWPLRLRQVGPIDVVKSIILFIHYGVTGGEDLIPGFSWFVRGNLPTGVLCLVLSKRRQGVTCGVACNVAERAV